MGQRDHQIGLLPEALEKFLAAEHLNKVNFPLQLQIGKLFLYGKTNQDDIINLPKAEEHFLLAARYAGAEEKWGKCRGEALFHAAITSYLLGEQLKNSGHLDAAQESLESALARLQSAIDSWPAFTESYYLAAKCHALLGQKEKALDNLEILSDRDRRYFAKMSKDRDFDSIHGEASEIFQNAIINPGPTARAAQIQLSEFREKVNHLINSGWKCKEELELIPTVESFVRTATLSLLGGDANIEGILSEISLAEKRINEASRNILINNCIPDPEYDLPILPKHQLPKIVNIFPENRWNPNRIQLQSLRSITQNLDGSLVSSLPCSIDMIKRTLAHTWVLNVNILNHLLAHPDLIPKEWTERVLEGISNGMEFSRFILFLGTLYGPNEYGWFYVRGLHIKHGNSWEEGLYVLEKHPSRSDSNGCYRCISSRGSASYSLFPKPCWSRANNGSLCYHFDDDHYIATYMD